MDNSEVTLQCQNLNCLASNPATNKFCFKCGTPLVRRYLRVLGDWVTTHYHTGDSLDERYLLIQPQIVLDTKPALSPQAPEEFPAHIIPYLKLFSYRLHIPQIYGYVPTSDDDQSQDRTIWLLEYGTIPTQETGELKYPNLLPELEQIWPEASALRQLHWLWQMAKLWQPLQTKEAVSSLLNPALLRVNGRIIQLLQLQLDTDVNDSTSSELANFKQLGKLWSQWVKNASPQIQDFLEQLSQKLEQGLITRSEQLITILDQALVRIGQSQKRTYQIFTDSNTGPTREHNEDACYPITDEALTIDAQEIPLAIVCDGIGGQEGGEIASNLAIETLSKEVTRFYKDLSPGNSNLYVQSLEKAIGISNDQISGRNDNENRHERQRMGTTLVLGLAYGHEMYIAHVGDSRVYWITPTSCHQVTTDDDLASREVRLGYLAYRDAVQYPNAGALVQALGMSGSSTLHPTIQRFLVDESCVFLLCSDGLSDNDRVEQFWESEIVPILNENKDIAEVGRQLITIANEKNGHDNVTVAIIYCRVEPNPQDQQTPLSFSDLDSSVPLLSGPTVIEPEADFDSTEDSSDEMPTVPSVSPATSIPTSSPTSTPGVSRSVVSLPILLGGLLTLGIIVVAGGYLAQQWLFKDNSISESPANSPSTLSTTASPPEPANSLIPEQFIKVDSDAQWEVVPENVSPTPTESTISVTKDTVFKIIEITDDSVFLKNCSGQKEKNSIPQSTSQFWILKTNLKSQPYKSFTPSSDNAQIFKNCQVANFPESPTNSSPSPVNPSSSPTSKDSTQ